MLEAVLFDWGDTLMLWAWEPDLLAAGHDAGLHAIGREPSPAMTARFTEVYLPLLWVPGTLEEIEYPAFVKRLLAEEGIDVDDEELDRFLDAEHAAWAPARQLASTTHALLEALRDRGLKLGLVSNAFDPPELLHRDLADLGVADRLDVAVFSSEVGRRKPHPDIFRRALDAIGVPPAHALFVGDTLATDIAGAAALGMHTCQALWFRADEDPDAAEPDFRAFTQMDVMTAVRRLR
ncbi:MAG TPA: HAD family hydrolase [Gaiellaceae bacterium]|nr:HAD family hydrolase [Gaiellaceae bacterium]